MKQPHFQPEIDKLTRKAEREEKIATINTKTCTIEQQQTNHNTQENREAEVIVETPAELAAAATTNIKPNRGSQQRYRGIVRHSRSSRKRQKINKFSPISSLQERAQQAQQAQQDREEEESACAANEQVDTTHASNQCTKRQTQTVGTNIESRKRTIFRSLNEEGSKENLAPNEVKCCSATEPPAARASAITTDTSTEINSQRHQQQQQTGSQRQLV
ncbi:unnamed protein product [Ceratitis capitata]|uniref:(Mediterranean fruit fly) hypothetical protein n=1 Tax=Ceratitis capitata TaxID=7213 RepID=A0A811VI38_CERCA|nr:unnamed protein product [Ceratitis capitata]